MKKLILWTGLVSGVTFVLLMLGSVPASADTMPTPGSGPAYGQHVAAMSPGLGGMMNPGTFGPCVSSMATGVVCDCSCGCMLTA